jgi:hypothetical protein
MKNIHASEQAIQDYAMGQFGTNEEKIHIEFCAFCSAKVGNYQNLFAQIKQEPAGAFDFDLAGLVTAQLPNTKSWLSADRFIAGFLILFISCFIGIPVILFRKYMLNMFSGISPLVMYSIIFGAIIALTYKALHLYNHYRKQMQFLNFN